ncbi:BTB/POZ domain-containing protein At4g08455-like [Syzygium oleosum]|uniref:BTB/POZ domain-containing protein At4g08455-like n=1 Tax=Syzygium oleosum TaxID=219896 RepID=UPI0024BB15F6|nr:BTB/POZ domain-containing protein At4g08455-like [Syzygium oleosum]
MPQRLCARQEHPAETESMRCMSAEHADADADTRKESYEEASETVEELEREIEHLKSKVASLRSCSPTDHHHHLSGPGSTDVVLVAAEDGNGGPSMPVPARRAVLASRSPVFKAMLENEMEESRSGTIKISDMSYDALRAFVDYLYAEAGLDEQMVCELLILAEKYQVEHLKAYCEKFLVSKLNWDNSIKNYAFAHQHKAKVLLEASLSLILDNMGKFPKHPKYPELVELRLANEIYIAFLAKWFNW